mgnify:CR=1 FL=1
MNDDKAEQVKSNLSECGGFMAELTTEKERLDASEISAEESKLHAAMVEAAYAHHGIDARGHLTGADAGDLQGDGLPGDRLGGHGQDGHLLSLFWIHLRIKPITPAAEPPRCARKPPPSRPAAKLRGAPALKPLRNRIRRSRNACALQRRQSTRRHPRPTPPRAKWAAEPSGTT